MANLYVEISSCSETYTFKLINSRLHNLLEQFPKLNKLIIYRKKMYVSSFKNIALSISFQVQRLLPNRLKKEMGIYGQIKCL